MNSCEKPYTITHISEVDIDNIATIPDYFIGIRAIEDPSDGNTVLTPVRVPGERVMPTGNLANVTALPKNNSALVIPEHQVRAGYIDVQPGGNIMNLAGESHAAQFMMIGDYSNGTMLIQTTGFLYIPNGHQYLVGTQYYLGEDGEPVTDSTVTGQKLFRPLSDSILNINGEF